jgi:AcrR family transcriptional regulator
VPRAGLSRPVVVAEAARLADEAGWSHLTVAALAERFGVKLPSLYKHIDSLEGLRREVGALALRELGGELQAAAVGRSGSDALRAMASAYRAYARAHPGRYAATLAAPAPADEERQVLAQSVLQTIFAVLEGYGLGGDDLVHATRVLRACLHGFVSLEESGGFGMPHDVDASFDLLVQALHENLSRWGQRPGTAALST